MQCPFDATTLQIVSRSGIEIDWCPSCKGVWLERGELDKLIDHAAAMTSPLPPPAPLGAAPSAPRQYAHPLAADRRRGRDEDDENDDDDDRHHTGGDGYGRKRRRNVLSEIFDF